MEFRPQSEAQLVSTSPLLLSFSAGFSTPLPVLSPTFMEALIRKMIGNQLKSIEINEIHWPMDPLGPWAFGRPMGPWGPWGHPWKPFEILEFNFYADINEISRNHNKSIGTHSFN